MPVAVCTESKSILPSCLAALVLIYPYVCKPQTMFRTRQEASSMSVTNLVMFNHTSFEAMPPQSPALKAIHSGLPHLIPSYLTERSMIRLTTRLCFHRSLEFCTRHTSEDMACPSFDDWDNAGNIHDMVPSSEDEYSDGEVIINQVTDIDLPSIHEQAPQPDEALRVAAHRFVTLGIGRKKSRITNNLLNNLGLTTFSTALLLLVDWCAWHVVRIPLEPYYLMLPFFISGLLASFVGYICLPLLYSLKLRHVWKQKGNANFNHKSRIAIGGVFFILVGLGVAEAMAGSSLEVSAAVVVTLAFSVIGLLGDLISIDFNYNVDIWAWIKFLLQVSVALLFWFWLDTANLSSPYGIKMLIPLPPPIGLVNLGKYYAPVTIFFFLSVGNGVKLADGLDGLAGGIIALAFIGMSIAVLPLCPGLGIFGTSMAGACIGFLYHSGYKTPVSIGYVGAVGLGGGLAAMAACTGMFFPLVLSLGILVIEALFIGLQVLFNLKGQKHLLGDGRYFFDVAPLHRLCVLHGIKEQMVVAAAYILSCALALVAAYVGLLSV